MGAEDETVSFDRSEHHAKKSALNALALRKLACILENKAEAMCRTDWTEGVCSQEDELHVIAIVYARDYESQNEGGVGEQGMALRDLEIQPGKKIKRSHLQDELH